MRAAWPILIVLLTASLMAAACTRPPLVCSLGDAETPGSPVVAFVTPHGGFCVEVYQAQSPVTAANFLRYVEDGFYDDTMFHRLVRGFVLQGGGCTSDAEGKTPTHPPIANEARDSGLKNLAQTLSMARTSHPDSATSQFFINLRDNPSLDPGGISPEGYAVFGKVVAGWPVVETMAQTSTHRPAAPDACHPDENSVPDEPLLLERTTRVTA